MVVGEAQIAPLVRAQLEEILGNPTERARLLGSSMFGAEQADQLEKHEAQLQGLLADESLAHILTGPTWLSGASVVNGTITAPKISVNTLEAVQTSTGTLNVTGNITAAASFPATGARIVLNASALVGYNATPAEVFKLNVDGSGFIGIGGTQMSWNTAGVLTMPAAAIGSLTIADVGSGNFGGTYQSSASGARIAISSSGLLGYNSGGTNTFDLSASDGSLTMTGVFALRNATSGARVEISNVGLRGFNSGGTQTFGISSSDGSGFVGTGSTLTWNSSGTVSINGSVIVNGSVTANKLTVSNLAAISADLGTITAGTINASVITVTNLSFANIQQAGALGADQTLGTNDITVNSTGRINFGSGDYLANDLLHFEVGSGDGAKIEMRNGSGLIASMRGSSSATTADINLRAQNSGNTEYAVVRASYSGGSPAARMVVVDTAESSLSLTAGVQTTVLDGDIALLMWEVSSVHWAQFAGRIYPGSGATQQSNAYIAYNTTGDDKLQLVNGSYTAYLDAASRFVAPANIFPGNQENRYFGDNGTHLGFSGLTLEGTAGALVGYYTFVINGTARKIPYYATS